MELARTGIGPKWGDFPDCFESEQPIVWCLKLLQKSWVRRCGRLLLRPTNLQKARSTGREKSPRHFVILSGAKNLSYFSLA